MKIKSMTATFGRLDRARLEPGPGLTLIHAPNEGGKSTWAAFWRAMLYGIDTGDRDKKGYLADKNRYQPWSGAPMEGEVTLELEGREITIRRGSKRNAPFGVFSAVYAGTQEPVPGLTAANCGELLTGVGAAVFTRSAFLGNGNLSLTTAPELERRIAALVTSGSEDVSFSQAMERLKAWKNRRQVNRSVGEIPKLEGELVQVREQLKELEDISAQAARLEGELVQLTRERERLTQQAQAHRLLAQKQLSQRYAQAEAAYQSAQDQYTALEKELSRFGTLPDPETVKQAQGELQYIKVLEGEIKQGEEAITEAEEAAARAREDAKDIHFTGMSGDEAAAKAAEEAAAVQIDLGTVEKHRLATPGIAAMFIALFVLLGGIGYLSTHNITLCLWLSLSWTCFVIVTTLINRRKVKAARKRIDAVLSRYGVGAPEELTALAQRYRERCQAAEKAAHEADVIRNAVADRREKRDAAKAELLDFVHGFAPEVKDLFGCSAALSRALNLDHDLSLARERAQERRRRLDDLAAQGAGAPVEEVPALPVPEMSAQETDRALTRTADRLEQVSAQCNQVHGTLQTMGDPAALAAQREELETVLARKRLELDALTAAIEGLTHANALLQERFSPELNRLAGEYMARLTGGKYPAVSLTRELEGFVRTGGEVLPRSALYLSRGTVDQLYLAVRLAVCRLCLPERPPILLDDALAAFDDARLMAALELLWDLSGEQQVLLFTCQSRESQALGSTPGVTRAEL